MLSNIFKRALFDSATLAASSHQTAVEAVLAEARAHAAKANDTATRSAQAVVEATAVITALEDDLANEVRGAEAKFVKAKFALDKAIATHRANTRAVEQAAASVAVAQSAVDRAANEAAQQAQAVRIAELTETASSAATAELIGRATAEAENHYVCMCLALREAGMALEISNAASAELVALGVDSPESAQIGGAALLKPLAEIAIQRGKDPRGTAFNQSFDASTIRALTPVEFARRLEAIENLPTLPGNVDKSDLLLEFTSRNVQSFRAAAAARATAKREANARTIGGPNPTPVAKPAVHNLLAD